MKHLALFLLLLSKNLFAGELLDISISPDFTITIKNISENKITIDQVGVESFQNEKWSNTRSDVTCSCGAKCKKSPIFFEAKEIKVISWDKKDNRCNLINSGSYRVSIYGKGPIKEHNYKTLGTSIPFKYTGAQ